MGDRKKRKVDGERQKFNKGWTAQYFSQVLEIKLCIICREGIAVFKEHNLNVILAQNIQGIAANYPNMQGQKNRSIG